MIEFHRFCRILTFSIDAAAALFARCAKAKFSRGGSGGGISLGERRRIIHHTDGRWLYVLKALSFSVLRSPCVLGPLVKCICVCVCVKQACCSKHTRAMRSCVQSLRGNHLCALAQRCNKFCCSTPSVRYLRTTERLWCGCTFKHRQTPRSDAMRCVTTRITGCIFCSCISLPSSSAHYFTMRFRDEVHHYISILYQTFRKLMNNAVRFVCRIALLQLAFTLQRCEKHANHFIICR